MRFRPSRRAVLAGLGGGAIAGAAAAVARERLSKGSHSVRVPELTRLPSPRVAPVRRFEIAAPQKRRFGALEFRSGLAFSGDYDGIGGFSGMAWLTPGERLLLVTDVGEWFAVSVATHEGELTALRDFDAAPMLSPGDRPPMDRVGRYDAEAVTIAPDGAAYVAYEGVHEIWRYDLPRAGLKARAEPVMVPAGLKKLAANKGIESLAAPPAGHPLDGRLVAIGERPQKAYPNRAVATPAWVVPARGGPGEFAFECARFDDYDVSDAAFLPSGELLVLERRFRLADGMRVRLRRAPAAAIRPGARIAGELIFEADMGHEIDNLEGLAVHRDGHGDVILTFCSDDNFNWFQRNLLLQFRYVG